jgi:hypothetical protein
MAGFSINDFLSQVEDNGILRSNKFKARFPVPNGLLNQENSDFNITETSRLLEFWCDSTQIPSLIFATHPIVRYGYGTSENKPFLSQIQNLNFTFMSDASGAIWNFFYSWMNTIINIRTDSGILDPTALQQPYEVGYKYDYASDVNIICYNDIGEAVFNVILIEAYPVFLGEIPLAWSEKNTIVRFPVSFTFNQWILTPVDEGA